MLKWQLDRIRNPRARNPRPDQLPAAQPNLAVPTAEADELRVTWIGHSSLFVQIGGTNILFDPVFSRRASPFTWMGPLRLSPPGLTLGQLPRVDAVVISH